MPITLLESAKVEAKWATKEGEAMTKFFLTILVFICSVSGIYSAYLLFKDEIEPIVGAILISACIVVFIWCLSLLKKHRLGGGNVFWVFVITILLLGTTVAYAGVEPMSGAKDKMVSWLETKTSEITEPKPGTTTPNAKKPIILKEYFLGGTQLFPSVIELNKIQQWVYSSSKQLPFKSLNPPYVVNAAIRTKTSQVATNLTVSIYRKDDPYKTRPIPITTRTIQGMGGRQGFIIEEKGDYIIDVKSVGCEWWVMVGHESEGVRQ